MSINFIVSLAQNVDDNKYYDGREKQYMYALARIFSYNLPVYGVVSETHNNANFKPKYNFSFKTILDISSTDKQMSKSQKEFYSIKAILNTINLDNNDWIIKVSGRYMIYNDIFINTIKSCDDSIKAVIRICDNDTQMYTFLFGLRWKYFKEFFMNVDLPNNINLERVILLYIQSKLNESEIKVIDELGIFCNIADGDEYRYF